MTPPNSGKDALKVKKTIVDVDEDGDQSAGPVDIPQASWDEIKTGDELESYIEDIADTVRIGLDQSIAILTPWFFNNMPRIYYQTTPRPEKVRHLSAIITGHVFETKQTVELWDRDRSKVTYIGPGGDRQILLDMSRRLKANANLKMGSLYFSRDKLLFLSTFHCNAHKVIDRDNRRIMEKIKAARGLMIEEWPDETAKVDAYLDNLDNDFVMYATAARIQLTFRMLHHMLGHEGAHTVFEPVPNAPTARLTLGMKNVKPSEVLESILHLINRYEYNITRAFLVKFSEGYPEPVTVMHLILSRLGDQKVDGNSISMMRLNKALRTLGWVDVDEYGELCQLPYGFSINAANLIRAFAVWAHVMLGKENPYYYSQYKIRTTFFKYADFTRDLIQLFRIKFDPLKDEERRTGQYDTARAALMEVSREIIDEVERSILVESVNMLDHCLKTNYFLSTKTGLAFRIAPEALNSKYYPLKPFGIFLIVGKDYRFFHVRWKDISRGGLRVVMPRNSSEFDYALAGLFDEVYGLSHAQQLKNKDIPEGGSKAVLVLKPGGHRQQAVRGAVNALLDLLVARQESDEASAATISYYDRDEIIYLGPDENITNDLIEWIPMQAARRGYRYAAAFMSSKPGAGINHKEYGVTSEGLNVYVDNVLRNLGINPKKDRFTIKMTGGPDGDVAGNELKILAREYGENCRVVAIADGFGAAFDPEGLAWPELLRLFKEGRPIADFDPKCLSGHNGAFAIKADSAENVRTRNNLHFNAQADIFIPAGGRPYTVNDKNWRLFLGEDGKATCRAVVEGANIFFTSEARAELQKAGVLIIKDSTANKTGVICSSYEIIASLTLSTDEFLAIKDIYVRQVIDILRHKADQEAKLLFQEYAIQAGRRTLVELSMAISRQINDVTDVILEKLTSRRDEVLADPLYQELIYRHCPAILVERYRERLLERLPPAHQIAILSASIASFVVYREGLSWLDGIPTEGRFEAVRTYMQQDNITTSLVKAVESSVLPDRDKIASILKMSATRDLTILEMERRAGGTKIP